MVPSNCETDPLQPKDVDESPASENSETGGCLSRLRRCFLVEPVLILYLMGIFPVGTISQKYILQWITNESLDELASQNISFHQTNTTVDPCHSNKSDPVYLFQEHVQSKSSQFALYESILGGVPAVFVTIILGAGSDLFGRRLAILPPLVGAMLSTVIATCIISTKSSIYWFLLRDALCGCCGSFFSVLMGCFAFVADRTPPEKRMIRITFIEMTMLISGVICPIVLGKVTTAFGFLPPLLFVVATSVVNLVYVSIVMPNEIKRKKGLPEGESTSERPPSSSNPSKFHSTLCLLWIQIRAMMALFVEKSAPAIHWRRLKLNLLIMAFFITNLPTFDVSVTTLFMMNSPLCWDVDTLGLFSGVSCGVASVGAMIAAPLFKRFGMPDYVIAILAGLASTATSVYKGFVQTTVMMFISMSLSMIAILFYPSLRSLMSNHVNDDQQGSIFGAIACVEIICGIVGTTIFNSVYSATLHISTGFVFFVMAAFYLAGSALVCFYIVLIRLDAKKGSTLYVPVDEPLLDDGESDPVDGLHNGPIN